jgi:hypothetical protein
MPYLQDFARAAQLRDELALLRLRDGILRSLKRA